MFSNNKLASSVDKDALQQNIDKLMSWSCDWQFCFNASKCKNIERTYKLACVEGILYLAEVDNESDQGVNIQSRLQFDMHVTTMCAKANKTVGIIKHTYSCINIDMLRIFFKSLVRPILEYCPSAWSPYTNASARKIQQFQHRATEMVQNLKDVSYSDRHRIIGIPTLQFRRLWTDMIQVYNILDGYEDIDNEGSFTVDSVSYTRGHPFKLKKTRGNTVRRIAMSSYHTVNDWNSLPLSVVQSNSVNCLKSRLNAWKEHPLKCDADSV